MRREYLTWYRMVRRCGDPTDKDFPYYGGRGIRVCEAWRESFRAFLAYMGPKPSGLTLERKNAELTRPTKKNRRAA